MKIVYKKSSDILKNKDEKFLLSRDEKLEYILFLDSQGDYKIDLSFSLKDVGAEAYIYIIEKGIENQNVEVNISVVHESPSTFARTFVRRVMYDGAKSYINGLIKIDKGSQNSNSYFDESTLLLGDQVISKVIPSLEIIPDNVKASHSSTTTYIPEEEVFYLQSRGIDKNKNYNMISSGFLKSKINEITDKEIKEKIFLDIDNLFL